MRWPWNKREISEIKPRNPILQTDLPKSTEQQKLSSTERVNAKKRDGNVSGSSSDADPAIGAREREKHSEFCKKIQYKDENKTKLSHDSISTSKAFEKGER